MSKETSIEVLERKEAAKETAIDTILNTAVERNVSIDVLERLIALRERVKADAARDEFFQALANFQAMKPRIVKKWVVMNRDGQTERYRYAKIDDITEQIDKPLADCGLSYSFETEHITDNNERFEITHCVLKHVAGHSERSHCKIPIEFSSAMNKAQSYATAGTYGRRYALCNALGLTPESDDDGHSITYDTEATATIKPPQQKAANGGSAQPPDIPPDRLVYIDAFKPAKEGSNRAACSIETKWYGIFDKKLADEAKRAQAKHLPVCIEYKVSGEYLNITALTVQE